LVLLSKVETITNEANNYRSDFGCDIPLKELSKRTANYMHAYTLYSAVRPFGATIMLGTWTEAHGPELYCIEPSGVFYGYYGCAAGKAKQVSHLLKNSDLNC
jgi:20S proteasome subunit alpha 7